MDKVVLEHIAFYSYLNLENTKTIKPKFRRKPEFYSYLNLENTKTFYCLGIQLLRFYSYLNLENTKTEVLVTNLDLGFIVT